MKYVHILGYGSMPTREMYYFLCEHFDHSEHSIITGNINDDNFNSKYGELKRINTYSIQTIIECYKAQYIIVHGFINRKLLYFFTFQPWLLKKCNWIVWGGDIYCHTAPKNTGKLKAYELMRKFIYPKIGYVTTLVEDDYEKAKEWYRVKGIHLVTSYPGNTSREAFLKALRAEKRASDTINILVGNSATVTNHHFAALDMLQGLKNENIHIFLPLNYGDPGYQIYAQKVIDYAESIYGKDKVTSIIRRIETDEYSRFLNTIDVGIFNNDRQQAMGNISQLVQYGAKVYLRKDTTMWKHFEQLGCSLYDIDEIENCSIKDLIFQDENIKQKNIYALDVRNSVATKLKIWTEMFNKMDEKQRCIKD